MMMMIYFKCSNNNEGSKYNKYKLLSVSLAMLFV